MIIRTLLVGFLLLTACDKIKKLDEMHDRMDHMDQQLGKTGQVICNTYIDLRQHGALDTRFAAIEALKATDNEWQMAHGADGRPTTNSSRVFFQDKISQAAKFFMAFEFQVEKGTDSHCLPRDLSPARMKDAVGEFFRTFSQFWTDEDLNETIVDPSFEEERYQNLLALSVAMHMENIDQEIDRRPRPEVVTMYELIKKALGVVREVEAGKVRYADLPEWTREILERQKEAVYIVQLRYNMLAAMAFNEMTGMLSKGPIDRGMFALWETRFNNTWQADFSQYPVAKLGRIHTYIDAAVKVRDVIEGFEIPGVEPMLTDWLARYYRHMALYNPKDRSNDEHAKLAAQINELVVEISQ